MAKGSHARTVATVYLLISYGLAVASILTFGGAEGGPELPSVAFGVITLPASLLVLLALDTKSSWLLALLLVMPLLNVSLGWIVWWSFRRMARARKESSS